MPKSDKYICRPKIIAFSAFIFLFLCALASFIATLIEPSERQITTKTIDVIPTHATFDANSTVNSTIITEANSDQWGAIPGTN